MRVYAIWTLEEGLNNCVLCNIKSTNSNTLFLPLWEVGGKNYTVYTILTVQELCVFDCRGHQSYQDCLCASLQ